MPSGVTLLDDPETVLATVTPPRLQAEEEPEIEEETELVGEGDDRRGGRRSGRGPGRGPRRGRGRERRRVAPPERLVRLPGRGGPVDWLIVGLGQPGRRVRGHPPQHRLPRSPKRWRSAGSLPKPKSKYRGQLTEGRTGPGGPRVAILEPQTYMNDAGQSVGPARGAFKLGARPGARDPRRDRPAVRRDPDPGGGRPGRAQRPEVDPPGARLA